MWKLLPQRRGLLLLHRVGRCAEFGLVGGGGVQFEKPGSTRSKKSYSLWMLVPLRSGRNH